MLPHVDTVFDQQVKVARNTQHLTEVFEYSCVFVLADVLVNNSAATCSWTHYYYLLN